MSQEGEPRSGFRLAGFQQGKFAEVTKGFNELLAE